MKACIVFQSLLTGFKSKGPALPQEIAEAWVDHLNEKWKGVLFHWTEST